MGNSSTDKAFTGSIPKLYETYLVPLIFEGYAADLVQRLAAQSPARVLEIAAGTGVVTRRMAATLPTSVEIVATDLNQAMLDQAAAVGIARSVEWQQADALALPFADESFDAVVCQFGAMFFPDKAKAFAEVHRVLRAGGVFIFNVWDQLADNEFADVVNKTLQAVFPTDPPSLLPRVPYGYFTTATIAQDLKNGGFTTALHITTVTKTSRADSAQNAALAYCQGTPVRSEIEARDATMLNDATAKVAQALAQQFGVGAIEGKIQALVISVEK